MATQPRTMTPHLCLGCGRDILVNENGSLYEDMNRMQYHTRERCLVNQLANVGAFAYDTKAGEKPVLNDALGHPNRGC